MTKKRKLRITAVIILAVTVAALFWYYRPVGIYDLEPEMDVDIISISLIRNGGGSDMEDRSLHLERGDEGFEETLEQIEAFQFRRPPTNLVVQALPFLADLGPAKVKTIEDYEYHIYISLANEASEIWDCSLSCWFDEWEYRDFDRSISLPLTANGEAKDARALGDHFWKMAHPVESHS